MIEQSLIFLRLTVPANVSLMVASVVELSGAGTPLAVSAAIATAIATSLALRRITSSMNAAARETIDGLRQENERLRARLADQDKEHDQ